MSKLIGAKIPTFCIYKVSILAPHLANQVYYPQQVLNKLLFT